MKIIEKPFNKNCSNRYGTKIDMICLHIAQCPSIQALSNWANSKNNTGSSWHYGVDRNGDIYHYCPDQYAAWTQGAIKKPLAKLVIQRGTLNPNRYCIGIETVGYFHEDWPLAKIKGTAELLKWLCKKYQIPMDRDHIIGHYEIDNITRSTCPCRIDYRATLWKNIFNFLDKEEDMITLTKDQIVKIKKLRPDVVKAGVNVTKWYNKYGAKEFIDKLYNVNNAWITCKKELKSVQSEKKALENRIMKLESSVKTLKEQYKDQQSVIDNINTDPLILFITKVKSWLQRKQSKNT